MDIELFFLLLREWLRMERFLIVLNSITVLPVEITVPLRLPFECTFLRFYYSAFGANTKGNQAFLNWFPLAPLCHLEQIAKISA